MRLSVFMLIFFVLGFLSKKNKIQFLQPNINYEIKKTFSLIGIIINDGKNLIKLTISNQSREINNELSFPFEITSNYKKIKV